MSNKLRILLICMILCVLSGGCGSDGEYSDGGNDDKSVHFIIEKNVLYKDRNTAEERTEIVLGCIGEQNEVRRAVAKFNNENTEYRIKVVDYTQEEEITAVNNLYNDILSGKGVDLIRFDSQYIDDRFLGEKGVLEDLNPYLAQSRELNREDLASSGQKEGAWQFIESFFSEEWQDSITPYYNFSVCKEKLTSQFEEAMVINHYFNREGEEKEAPILTYDVEGDCIEVFAAREQDIKELEKAMNQAQLVKRNVSAVENIIQEEAGAYFGGEKTLDEVVDIIENRLKDCK